MGQLSKSVGKFVTEKINRQNQNTLLFHVWTMSEYSYTLTSARQA